MNEASGWQPMTITTLETIWPLLEEPIQASLEPYKEAAAWFRGPLSLWPPLGIMVQDVDAQQAVTAALEAHKVSGVVVLSRLDAANVGLGLDAYHLPLGQLVVAYLSFTRATASVVASTAKFMEQMKLDTMLTILWQLMASCRVQKPLAACSAPELDAVQTDAANAIATVLARLAQPGAPAVQGPQPQEPPAPSAVTAPLQLLADRPPASAPVLEFRPFGFHNAAQTQREQRTAWETLWYSAPRYL
jgi:hypothetical protein